MRQTTPTSCGPASLATILTYYLKRPITDGEMIDLSNSRGEGTGAEDLEKACSAINYRGCVDYNDNSAIIALHPSNRCSGDGPLGTT